MPNLLPDFPAGLTASWLTDILRRHADMPQSCDVLSVTVEQVGEGVGMMSELSRVKLSYSEVEYQGPRSVIAKYPSQNPTNREVAMSFNLYEREVRYFAELDPLTQATSPAALLTLLDGDNFIILMQDMGDYLVGNQIEGANLLQTQLAVDELAKLHGAFWTRVDQLDWIPGIAKSYHADNMQNYGAPGWDNMLDVFGAFIPNEIAQQKDAFFTALPKLQNLMHQPPATIIHGDFRMENLLFGVQPDHHRVVIIDWQGPLVGRGLVDVCLLLAQSTQTEIRREHEKLLLDRYIAGLQALGIGYPDTDPWQDYRLTHLYNWVYVAVVSGALDASNDRAFAWMSQMIKRQVATSIDLDLFSLLPIDQLN